MSLFNFAIRGCALSGGLVAAVKEGTPAFRVEVKTWRDSVRATLCEDFNAWRTEGGSLKIYLANHGFEGE